MPSPGSRFTRLQRDAAQPRLHKRWRDERGPAATPSGWPPSDERFTRPQLAVTESTAARQVRLRSGGHCANHPPAWELTRTGSSSRQVLGSVILSCRCRPKICLCVDARHAKAALDTRRTSSCRKTLDLSFLLAKEAASKFAHQLRVLSMCAIAAARICSAE